MGRLPTTRSNIHQRFWSKVDMTGDWCWEWTGTRMTVSGYGAFWLPAGWVLPHGRMHSANRVAYYLTTGVWPADLDVCHSCDNPPCVRPGHLWAGTTKENMRDMTVKGRRRSPGAPGGERHPDHKTTDAQVLEITLRARAGESPGALADEYGVSAALVFAYRKGTRRKSVTAMDPENVVRLSV